MEGSGLDPQAVENQIRADIEANHEQASAVGEYWGRVEVDGHSVEYRAYPRDDGTINVGTYYLKDE